MAGTEEFLRLELALDAGLELGADCRVCLSNSAGSPYGAAIMLLNVVVECDCRVTAVVGAVVVPLV